MDPLDFMVVAAQMCNSANEAERRTSIGRSYYAVFNMVDGRLTQVLGPARIAEGHWRARAYLERAGLKEMKIAGARLHTLRRSRNDADYSMQQACDMQKSQLAYQLAQKTVQQLGAIANANFNAAIAALGTLRYQREDE